MVILDYDVPILQFYGVFVVGIHLSKDSGYEIAYYLVLDKGLCARFSAEEVVC